MKAWQNGFALQAGSVKPIWLRRKYGPGSPAGQLV